MWQSLFPLICIIWFISERRTFFVFWLRSNVSFHHEIKLCPVDYNFSQVHSNHTHNTHTWFRAKFDIYHMWCRSLGNRIAINSYNPNIRTYMHMHTCSYFYIDVSYLSLSVDQFCPWKRTIETNRRKNKAKISNWEIEELKHTYVHCVFSIDYITYEIDSVNIDFDPEQGAPHFFKLSKSLSIGGKLVGALE